MKKLLLSVLTIAVLCSFYKAKSLTGTWNYAGDIYNGKKEAAPTDYILQRKYDDTSFTAIVIEKGYDPEKYETGRYSLNADSCLETQTWCGQQSSLLNIPVHYHYRVSHDTLILNGILPNGSNVTEYWQRVK